MPPRVRADAGPSGRATLREVRHALRQGWPPGLTVLSGADTFHLDLAQREILAALADGDDPGSGPTVFEHDVEVGDVVGAARSAPMFVARRVVFVRDAALLDGEPDALAAYAAQPPGFSHLLVRAPTLDLRRALHKTLAEAGRLLRFGAAPVADAAAEIAEMAASRGLRLEAAVAALVLDACGADLHRADRELDKIAAWLGPASDGRVDAAVVRQVCASGGLFTGWEIADAVMRRDAAAAAAAVRQLIDRGEEPLKILGGLAWRARMLLRAAAMAAAGVPGGDIERELRAWFFRDVLRAGLARYSAAELLRFPSRLLAADRSLKSRGLDARAVLERLVDDLTAPVAGAEGA
jgi:DNA polymerase-3 subunit delta